MSTNFSSTEDILPPLGLAPQRGSRFRIDSRLILNTETDELTEEQVLLRARAILGEPAAPDQSVINMLAVLGGQGNSIMPNPDFAKTTPVQLNAILSNYVTGQFSRPDLRRAFLIHRIEDSCTKVAKPLGVIEAMKKFAKLPFKEEIEKFFNPQTFADVYNSLETVAQKNALAQELVESYQRGEIKAEETDIRQYFTALSNR